MGKKTTSLDFTETIVTACFPETHHGYWSEYTLSRINVRVKKHKKDDFIVDPGRLPPYFWNKGLRRCDRMFIGDRPSNAFVVHRGYCEARSLIGHGTVRDVENLSFQALDLVTRVFREIDGMSGSLRSNQTERPLTSFPEPSKFSVQITLSPGLEHWKRQQHDIGLAMPPKGAGLTKASHKILEIFGATNWPEALQTNNALFGSGIISFLVGAADVPNMFSNYVTDMAFYYEHGYDAVFPSLEKLLNKGIVDPYALCTPGGSNRREGVRIGKRYIQGKIALEKHYKSCLVNRSAKLDRRTAQIVSMSESSLLGLATETMARGFDAAATMNDLVFSSPGTDVVDVGSDLLNSEIMNSFLNVGDITETGVVSEDGLRRVYDAYAAAGARMFTERWHEPGARMCAILYSWHIQNDRHKFFRRAILGWSKARKMPARPQREADYDEVFDQQYCTTGFSRPLDARYECNGEDTCDHVNNFLCRHQNRRKPLLQELWWFLVVGPLEYVRGGKMDEPYEEMLAEGSRLRMAQLFSHGLIHEMAWLIAHASHHAWQVNYLFEAAMFGSILDEGKLIGKLDRHEGKVA